MSNLTFGVEEEFFLADPTTGRGSPAALEVHNLVSDVLKSRFHYEYYTGQIETVTGVCSDISDLGSQLKESRLELSRVASALDVYALAVGTPPLGDVMATLEGPRYSELRRRYGHISNQPLACGMHVHVGVENLEMAVQVCNHIRSWLPTIQALAGNSPFTDGVDSGYSSWRYFACSLWPTYGPSPLLRGVSHYRSLVRQMMASGQAIDEGMIYWFARPSSRFSTVEVRIPDVCLSADDAIVIASIVRALVVSAVRDIEIGVSAPHVQDVLLRGAHWRAAKDGLEGKAVDFSSYQGVLVPAPVMVSRLIDKIWPSLVHSGDFEVVLEGIERLYVEGSGSARQRKAFAQGGFPSLFDLLRLR